MPDHPHPFCKRGHALEGDNVAYHDGGTRRECRICRNDRRRGSELARDPVKVLVERLARLKQYASPDCGSQDVVNTIIATARQLVEAGRTK